jgi:hypothetical protein
VLRQTALIAQPEEKRAVNIFGPFVVHDSSQTAVDRFVRRDKRPGALIARIEEPFEQRRRREVSPPVN